MSRPRRCVDWKAYDRCRAQLDGTKGADAALARSIDMAPRHFAPCKRTRHREAPPAAVDGADDAHVEIPGNGNPPALPASQPITAHGGEPPTWVSRGGRPAVDRLGLIEPSAQQHRLEKPGGIDLFWRTGAAHLGEGVRHDG